MPTPCPPAARWASRTGAPHTRLYWGTDAEPWGHAIPSVSARSAPSVVVAAGRAWIFYTDTSYPDGDTTCNGISYTSTADFRSFTTPVGLEDACTRWDPEASYYAPLGGWLWDGRVWLFYKQPQRPLGPSGQQEEGARGASFVPDPSGVLLNGSGPTDLWQLRVAPDPFFSAFQWGPGLWLWHPRTGGGGALPLWRTSRLGQG